MFHCSGFWVSGFGFQVRGFEFRVCGFQGFGFRVESFGLGVRVWGSRFHGPEFRVLFSGFGVSRFWVSCSGFSVFHA